MVPIIAIVLILSFTIAPVPPGILMAFIIGAILLVVGMMFFTLGAEMSMTPMGERIGTRIAQSKRLPVIIGLCFILGFIITISEPDLQVLAYFASLKPVSSEISVMVCFCSFRSWAACFSRISRM